MDDKYKLPRGIIFVIKEIINDYKIFSLLVNKQDSITL